MDQISYVTIWQQNNDVAKLSTVIGKIAFLLYCVYLISGRVGIIKGKVLVMESRLELINCHWCLVLHL